KRIVRNHSHAIVHVLVHIRDVIELCAPVDNYRVVDIRYSRDAHRRIGDVYVVHVGAAHAVSGEIDFSGSQREPSHANTGGKPETRTAAHECNQGRRPDGPNHDRSWNPDPAIAYKCPTSVVEGSESPGLIFNPGPAPG